MSHLLRRGLASIAIVICGLTDQAIATAANDPSIAVAYALPGDRAYPESIAVDPRNGDTYVSSYTTGAVFRAASGAATAETFLAPGADGRNTANGVKVDPAGRLWVIDSTAGVSVYDTVTHARLARFTVAATNPFFVNDLAFTADGTAYLTDSKRPVVYRVTPGQFAEATANGGCGELIPAMDLGAVVPPHGPDAFTLNGIAVDPTGRYLLTVDMTGGGLFRASLNPGDPNPVRKVTLNGGDMKAADGIELRGETLWVAHNSTNSISRWRLSDDGATATQEQRFTDQSLRVPTGLVHVGDRLLVTASQFDKGGPMGQGTPTLPFAVLDVSGI
ncbi:SMP-30/gluconolactonase/LRE family protein [Nocardia arthritidis]|uniref:Superoxide dismutase n=1 Tax=Nocardia arthritidis TaxID=228602 RepID=A0A6G9YSR8_9NOCA|nr:superoxide dismutase [Nocardia arthritidis]QIS16211.1 superoxide dismutase [Nocardia arthritidis]